MFLPVTPRGQVPVTAAGEPVLVEKVPGGVGKHAVVDLGTLQACAYPEDGASELGQLESATFFADQPVILQAIALLSLIHISEPTRLIIRSRMPSSA